MFDYIKLFEESFGRNDSYTLFNNKIATKYGLLKAIVLFRVHYVISEIRDDELSYGSDWHYRDGRWWADRTYDWWCSLMPYISKTNLRRTFTALKEDGLLLCSKDYRVNRQNHTLWWSINYEKILRDMHIFFDVSKMDSFDVSKLDRTYNIYYIYINIPKKYKFINNKESAYADQSATLRFLRNLSGLDRSKLLSLLTFTFSEYTDRFDAAHPRLPDNDSTVELLGTLLDMEHRQGMDEFMSNYVEFLDAEGLTGDKHLWLFCSEKIQAWLKAIKTDDYDSWAVATDRIAH